MTDPVAIAVWKRAEREIEAESPGFDAEHTQHIRLFYLLTRRIFGIHPSSAVH
jgi:hypothetical protein